MCRLVTRRPLTSSIENERIETDLLVLNISNTKEISDPNILKYRPLVFKLQCD